jgi:hypothetical protein
MKPLAFSFIVALMLLGLSNCSNNGKPTTDKKPQIDTVGSYKTKNLNGLSHFIIGKSVYSMTLSDLKKEWRTAKKEIGNTGIMGNAYIYTDMTSVGMGEAYDGLTEIKMDTTKKFESEYDLLHDDIELCKDIKRIKMYDYFVGKIDIRNLTLTFFKDTLYKISSNQNEDIDSAFIIKYGKGKYMHEITWLKNGRIIVNPDEPTTNKLRTSNADISHIFEQRIWENGKIKAESITDIEYLKTKATSYKSDFYIILKDTTIENEIKQCHDTGYKKAKDKIQREKNADLNKL